MTGSLGRVAPDVRRMLVVMAAAIIVPGAALVSVLATISNEQEIVGSLHHATWKGTGNALVAIADLRLLEAERGNARAAESAAGGAEERRLKRHHWAVVERSLGKLTQIHRRYGAAEDFAPSLDRLQASWDRLKALREADPASGAGERLAEVQQRLLQFRLLHIQAAHERLQKLERLRVIGLLAGGIAGIALLLLALLFSRRGLANIGRAIAEREHAGAELRVREESLREAQALARLGSWELDLATGRLDWSAEIYRIFEIDPARFGASYEAFLNAVHPEDRDAVNRVYTDSVRDRGPYEITHRLLLPGGRIKWVHEKGETNYSPEGAPLRSVGMVLDITERKLIEMRLSESLREKETLLREIHHRVKNNLQIISSLMYFQERKLDSASGRALLKEGQDRLRSMILVHEKLYKTQNLARVDFVDYLRTLAEHLRRSYGELSGRVSVQVEAEAIELPVDTALPLGMLATELLSNAFKHAFPGAREGRVLIKAGSRSGRLFMEVLDDGAGLPGGFDPEASGGFGSLLARRLVEQLSGQLRYERGAGTRVSVEIPLEEQTAARAAA